MGGLKREVMAWYEVEAEARCRNGSLEKKTDKVVGQRKGSGCFAMVEGRGVEAGAFVLVLV